MAKTRVVAGIDVGSSKIATLIGQYNEEEDKLSIVGVASSPSRGVRKGQIVDIEEAAGSVVESVEAAERMAGYQLSRALVTVGGAHIDSLNSQGVVAVSDPSGEIDSKDIDRVLEAARAVSLPTSRDILHVIPKEYKVDGETQVKDPQGMTGIRLEVVTHLITGSTTAIKNVQKCISEVGVSPNSMVAVPLASSFSILSDTERELGVVLVDVGGGTTSVAAYVEGSVAYSSVFPIGGRNVTNDIAAGLRVSLEQAEKIKTVLSQEEEQKKGKEKEENYGDDELELARLGIEETERKVSKKTLTDGIIRPRLNEIFTMVGMGLSEAQVAGKTPSGVVVTGGGSLCVGAQDAARRMLSLPARIGYPRGVAGLVDEVESPIYAASVGLLIFATREEVVIKGGFGSSIFSKIENIPVKGLVSRAAEIIKNLLP